MKKYLILLLFVVVTTQADIYRLVDEQGNISYSDQIDSNTEQIELKDLLTYTPVPIPVEIEEHEPIIEAGEIPDYQIVIISPTQDENIWGETDNIIVSVDLIPELDTKRADRLFFKLDGRYVGKMQTETNFSLTNLDRGSHTVAVSIMDTSGKVLRNSRSILFYIH